MIPELVAAGFAGYVTVLTGSKHDIRSMLATLLKTEEEREKRGKTLAWLPFTLERVKEEISSPAWENEEPGKRHKVVKSLLKLTPSEEWIRAQVALARSEYLALPMPMQEQAETTLERNRQLLHSGDDEAEWDEIIENGNGKESPEPEPEPEPKPKSEPKPEPKTNNEPTRPYTAAQVETGLKAAIKKKPSTHQDAIATPGQQGLIAGKLDECFAPAEDASDRRHAVLGWLFGGRQSVKELTIAEAGAVLDWLLDKEADAGTYDLNQYAAAEAAAIWRETQVEEGQGELPLM